jgi:hypothetical protein
VKRRPAAVVAAAIGVLLMAAVAFAQRAQPGVLRPGDPAPDFSLEPPGGGPAVALSSFRGRSPVALVFGSYT